MRVVTHCSSVTSCFRPRPTLWHVHDRISFQVEDVAHFFRYPHESALKPISITASDGQLIGIMGSSGSGKSTLLNILNGSQAPSFGRVLLNGRDIYQDASFSSGLIGHIAQDDVLISELTVQDNLRYSAALSLGDLDKSDLHAAVDKTLRSLGLWDIRDLRVGSVMDKTISGGQRKRLNIALELIREPAVLFVDEPTSGLSSRDSEHIMDILKELTLRGKVDLCGHPPAELGYLQAVSISFCSWTLAATRFIKAIL